jgi:arylsulfatase A-like enzyme
MKPNVLLLSLDTLRFDCVRAAGERGFLGDLADLVETPNIDALARKGAIFTNAVSAAPFTTPSHASLFTGLWPTQHRAHHQYRTPIAADARTVAERLSAMGYRTAMSAGRAPGEGVMFASTATGLQRGFDTLIFSGSVDRATRKWLEGPRWTLGARGRPWFLFFHTFAAHWPYGLEPAEAEAIVARAWETDDWGELRRLYVQNAGEADRMVGELVDQVDRLGQLDRTLVVVCADHGEGLHRLAPLHGPINGGREEVIRVPLVVYAPWACRAGTRAASQVRTVDVLPTVLELVGAPPAEEALPLAGASLAAHLAGGATGAERRAFFAGHLNDDPPDKPLLAGVRTERWKLVVDDCTDEKIAQFEGRLARNPDAALKADLRGRLLREMYAAREPVKLFDLSADPRETRNVASENPDVAHELRAAVERWLGAGPAGGGEAEPDAELEEQLRALGYLT